MIHGDVLGERARMTPEKLALVDVATGARLIYRELDRRAALCAAVLGRRSGLAKGERFAILAANRLEYLDFFFAAAKTGTVIVPLNTRLAVHELEYIVRNSGSRVVVYESQFADTVSALRRLVKVESWIALDNSSEGDPGYATLTSAEAAGATFVGDRAGPEDLYALLYTSGTTGRPKGVMIPHRMIAWNGYNTVVSWQLREDDISPIFTPLYHAGGLTVFLVPLVAVGGTVVLHRGFDPAEIWRTIEHERCTVALGVPTIWKLLMEAPEFTTVDLSSVRMLMSGGAPLPEDLARAYQRRGLVLKQGYGLTEVGVNCFAMTTADSVRKPLAIGKPLMMTQARLIDESGTDVPTGHVGELLLRGPHVSLGYWNDPSATAAALDSEGWFHTGDLARMDDEGFFYIAGRRTDMFISGGVNVYPAEIEAELLQHPAVADVAVVGTPHETWGEVGVAFIVPRHEQGISAEGLAEFLEPRLARYKIPKQFLVIESLPRSAYGKVQKARLAALLSKGTNMG